MPRSELVRLCRLVFHAMPLAMAATLLIVSVAINLANVVGRYVFLYAIYWAEEAMVYMAIWSIFLAAVAITYDRADLTMDLFSTRLSSRWRRAADAVITTITVAVCLFLASQSLTITRTLIRNGQNSVALDVPMAIPQSSLLFGFLMIAAAVSARFLLRLPENDGPTHSETTAPS